MKEVIPAAFQLLNSRIHPVTATEIDAFIAAAVERNEKCVVANHNLHSLALAQRDPEMRALLDRADLVHVDGMAIIALARILGIPLKKKHRTAYIDWLPNLLGLAEARGWRVFYLGSESSSLSNGIEQLRRRFPRLSIAGHHGYFSTSEQGSNEVVAAIAKFRPQLLFVGMGMPFQEQWVLRNLSEINANIILPCGACLDYFSGAKTPAPRWLGRMGAEWLFRLATEPRRLAYRYLVEPWSLAPHIFRTLINNHVTRSRADS